MKTLARVLALSAIVGSVLIAACGSPTSATFPGGQQDSGLTDTSFGNDGPNLRQDGSSSDGGGTTKCNPLTCDKLGYTCGPAGNGCGGSLSCGTCTAPETCGGGGKFSQCGGSSACIPKTCSDLGFNCGPAGDGCGGLLSCGTCSGGESCGGGGTPSQCGKTTVHVDGGIDGGACIPETCASQKIGCGPAGDGCGDLLSCGTCPGTETCGGGGTTSQCGSPGSTCVPATCLSLGYNCGPAADGCGGMLSCGSCTSPDICGGGGKPSVCGDVPVCAGLCKDIPTCSTGTTTLSGTVVAGTQAPYLGTSSPDPVPNVYVYIPNTTPSAFTDGPSCGCAPVTGDPVTNASGTIISATTDYQGNFTLSGIPVPPSGVLPLVIQLGKWRRYFAVGSTVNPPFPVSACTSNAAGIIHMPRSEAGGVSGAAGEGDIPLTAISTGNVDAMECVLLKMGVNQNEFVDPSAAAGAGRIQLFQGNGAIIDGATPAETKLVPTTATTAELDDYDQVIFPCWGEDPIGSAPGTGNAKTAQQQANVISYANNGGRVFATHYSYSWLYNVTPWSTTADWLGDVDDGADLEYNTGNGNIANPSTFPDVTTFYQWMNALATNGSTLGVFAITNERNDFTTPAAGTELWVSLTGAAPEICETPGPHGTCTTYFPTSFPVTYTFGTPYSSTTPGTCGRVIYSDFHVTNSGGTDGTAFPNECTTGEMIAQEKSLEYLIWDLASCPTTPGPSCTPQTCASLGINCGPAGDGCGGSLSCGTCTAACETCGGGGTPSVCGGTCCVPTTCTALGILCGPAGDGCGGTLACGTCPSGESCGGGGTDGVCGAIDSGTCIPETCVSQGIDCGPAGDGCGGLIASCGTCPMGETCGGGGTSGVCGSPPCTPKTCTELGFNCGPAGDGCGGSLNCGTCSAGQTCGASSPGVCGSAPPPK
jgi:hypothetical protein